MSHFFYVHKSYKSGFYLWWGSSLNKLYFVAMANSLFCFLNLIRGCADLMNCWFWQLARQNVSAACWPQCCHMMPPQGNFMGGQVWPQWKSLPGHGFLFHCRGNTDSVAECFLVSDSCTVMSVWSTLLHNQLLIFTAEPKTANALYEKTRHNLFFSLSDIKLD